MPHIYLKKQKDKEAKLNKEKIKKVEQAKVEDQKPLITNKQDTLAKIADYLDKGEDVPHLYIKSVAKDGELVKLFSDEEIQKMIEKQERKNKKIRKKIQKLKDKQAKKKTKSLKMSKL